MKISIIGAGMMGAAIGRLLSSASIKVLTPLSGRSAASLTRAADAGMIPATSQECAECDFILSIVPPSQALPAAQSMRGPITASANNPVYVECNAITPDQAREIGGLLQGSGCTFIDGGILGGPPSSGGTRSPTLYVSGANTDALGPLSDTGLNINDLAAPIGAASALKMALAGISKGQIGLLTHMTMLAEQEQIAAPFLKQLRQSQPGIIAWGEAQAKNLKGKSSRWAEEMANLAEITADIPGAAEHFSGMQALFHSIGTAGHTSPAFLVMMDKFSRTQTSPSGSK